MQKKKEEKKALLCIKQLRYELQTSPYYITCNFSYSVVSGTSAKQEVSWNFWLRIFTFNSASNLKFCTCSQQQFIIGIRYWINHKAMVCSNHKLAGDTCTPAIILWQTAINNVKWLICGDDPKNLAYQWALLPTCTLSRPF